MSMHRRPRPQRGTTVVELAVVVAVCAILLGLAAPDLRRVAAGRAIATQAAGLMADLRYARSEAEKVGERVTVCAVADPAAEPPRCVGGIGRADWRAGWLVFVDRNRLGEFDGNDRLLSRRQPLAPSGGVEGTLRSVTYTPAGFSIDAASHYLFRPASADGGKPPPRLVCVSKQGRARLASGAVCK